MSILDAAIALASKDQAGQVEQAGKSCIHPSVEGQYDKAGGAFILTASVSEPSIRPLCSHTKPVR